MTKTLTRTQLVDEIFLSLENQEAQAEGSSTAWTIAELDKLSTKTLERLYETTTRRTEHMAQFMTSASRTRLAAGALDDVSLKPINWYCTELVRLGLSTPQFLRLAVQEDGTWHLGPKPEAGDWLIQYGYDRHNLAWEHFSLYRRVPCGEGSTLELLLKTDGGDWDAVLNALLLCADHDCLQFEPQD